MPLPEGVYMDVMNLHDTFLNADLQRESTLAAPLVMGAEDFMVSPRGRYERTWVMFLSVLVEAWRSKERVQTREWIASVASTAQLESLLAEREKIDPLWETRSYMCHRDTRRYWDEGRVGVAHAGLEFNLALHRAFAEVLTAAMEAMRGTGDEPSD